MPRKDIHIPPALPVDYAETATIHEGTIGRGIRSVLLTSSLPGEGVSTIAYALAQHAAINGKRVLLVDFNTHNPFTANVLSLPLHPWDLDEALPEGTIFSIPGRGLDILSVPRQGTFSVARRSVEAVSKTVQTWLETYDIVIADAPCLTKPNSSGLPTAVLATCFDATSLVVASGETTVDAITQAIGRLEEQDRAVQSIILNDRGTPSFRAEIERQFAKWGRVGAVLRRFLWAPFASMPIFDEGY